MNSKKIVLFWLFSLALMIGLLFLLKGILLPFIASMVLAYFLDPVVEWGEKKGLSRTLSIIFLMVIAILVILSFIALAVPMLQNQIMSFSAKLPDYINRMWDYIHPLFERLKASIPAAAELGNIKETAVSYVGSGMKMLLSVTHNLISGGMAVFNVVSLLVITPVVCFYLLRDWHKVTSFFKGIIPEYAKETVGEQVKAINTILSGFIRGQAMVCLSLAFYYSVGLSLAGLDLGIVIGFLTGILSFIPYVGCLSGFVISMLLGLVQYSDMWNLLWIVGVFGIGQILEGYVLTPNLVGDKTGLHPVWIIFALMAGGYLLGFLGILIAVPTAAVIGVLIRFTIARYKQSSFYKGGEV
jgi:predicted PurR-regulated permease PerM